MMQGAVMAGRTMRQALSAVKCGGKIRVAMPFPAYPPGAGPATWKSGSDSNQVPGNQQVGQAGMWMAGWLSATLAMTLAGRQLAGAFPVFEVLMFRSLMAVVILLPFVMWNGGFKGRLSQFRLHILRNIIHYAGQYAWVTALVLIPLAEVIAIEFTMPLWIAILATAFLGERMYGFKIAALVIGFAGVLMIVKPGLAFVPGHLVALFAALMFAGTVSLTKYITRRDTALTVIFLMFAMQSVIGALPAYLTWVAPEPRFYPAIAVLGLTGTFSHYCLSKSLSLADATVVIPMDFLRLPLSALAGYLVYSEGIDAWSVAGGLMILAANTINLIKARNQ